MYYSSLGKRVIGGFIDSVAISVIATLIGVWYGAYITLLFYGVISLAYVVLLQGGPWHATFGQKVFDMCIVDENGMGIDYGKAILRYFCTAISSAFFCFGYIYALFSPERQTLHDKIAGTYVIDMQGSPAAPAPSVPKAPPSAHPTPGIGQIIGISGEKAGMCFPMSGNGVMMGRDAAVCHIVLKKSPGVSRMHCIVSYNPQSRMFIIADRNSTYGTFTERGERVTPQKSVALKSGERFYLGSKENMFEVR